MKKLFLFVCLLAILITGHSQITVPIFGKIEWVNGYAKEISGENIAYNSIYPDYASMALLTRCSDGKKVIEWETAPVPKTVKGDYVYFSGVAAHSSATRLGNYRSFQN